MSDGFGRVIFIRDNDSGEFWSIGHHPGEKPYDTFQAIHKPGSSVISSSSNDIETTATAFVPEQDSCEIWQIKMRNGSKKKRRLSLFFYFNLPAIGNCDVELKNNCLMINSKNPGNNQLLYFAFDHGVDSYDTSREAFIGSYRTIHNPRALEDGKCSRSAASQNPIAVIQKNITFGAAAVSETIAVIGSETIAGSNNSFIHERSFAARRAQTMADKYRRAHVAEESLKKLEKNWQQIEEQFTVRSPDEALNITQTIWGKYQNLSAQNAPHQVFNTAGAARQLVTFLPLNPLKVKSDLLEIFEMQLKDGRTVESIDKANFQNRTTDSVEGPAWLIIALTKYINETGDLEILRQQAKYFDGGQGSISEHLTRLAKHCLGQLNSSHLIEESGLEITHSTGLVAYAIKELIPVFAAHREHDLAHHYQAKLDDVKQSFNRRMWDGAWYLARRNHKKVGSKKNHYHKIDTEAQIWAIMSGLATNERAEKALNMLWRQAATPVGMANIYPAYPKYDEDNPESADSTGEKANGGIDVGLNSLLIACEALLGRGDLAYKLFQQHNFAYLSGNQENYKAEPYIYPAMVNGPGSAKMGRGDGSWQKNPGGWMWRVIYESILGAQPVLGGLKIEPCLPRDWRQVEYNRHFRGADYHIRIFNPTRQTKGTDRIIVDGISQTGNVIKPFQTGVHYVEIYLG